MTNYQDQARELANRHYTVITFRDKTTDGDYVYLARNPELDGCMAQGESLAESQENLLEVRIDYIEHLLEHNLPVPYPEWMVSQSASESILIELPPVESNRNESVFESIIQPDNREQLFEASLKTSE